MSAPEANWSGNHAYGATRIHHPTSVDELRDLVAGAESVHALGSRHSFTGIVDAGELVALDRLEREIVVDRAALTVSLTGQVTYAELGYVLNHEGVARLSCWQLVSVIKSGLPYWSLEGA